MTCPVHGPGYGRCLGCLAEAQEAIRLITIGKVDVPADKKTATAMPRYWLRRYWPDRFTAAEIDELAKDAVIEAA